MKNKGFSLIELLVVATIIIVLTTLGLISYRSANIRARDGKRKADLEQMRAALEMYRADENQYPAVLGGLVPSYIKELPADPKSSSGYIYNYQQGATVYTYTLDAYLEGGAGDTGQSCGGSPAVNCNYRVENP